MLYCAGLLEVRTHLLFIDFLCNCWMLIIWSTTKQRKNMEVTSNPNNLGVMIEIAHNLQCARIIEIMSHDESRIRGTIFRFEYHWFLDQFYFHLDNNECCIWWCTFLNIVCYQYYRAKYLFREILAISKRT